MRLKVNNNNCGIISCNFATVALQKSQQTNYEFGALNPAYMQILLIMRIYYWFDGMFECQGTTFSFQILKKFLIFMELKVEHNDIALHNFFGLSSFYHKPEKFQDKIWANTFLSENAGTVTKVIFLSKEQNSCQKYKIHRNKFTVKRKKWI